MDAGTVVVVAAVVVKDLWTLRRVGKGWLVGRLLGQLGTDPVRSARWAGTTGDRAGAAGSAPTRQF